MYAIDVVAPLARRSAHSATALSSSSAGTALFTSPIRSASVPLIQSPRNRISHALRYPTAVSMENVPDASPSLDIGNPKPRILRSNHKVRTQRHLECPAQRVPVKLSDHRLKETP